MTEPLPLSLLNDHLYCPRRAALKIVEGWREANVHTERGDIVHDHTDLAGYESQISNLGSQILLLRALPVWSERLGLSGKCDIVEVEPHSHSTNLKFEISNLKSQITPLPPAVWKAACEECSLFELCLPKATGADGRAERLARGLFEI